MNQEFHVYTIEEINHSSKATISENWDVTNFLAFVYAHDTTVGASNIAILAFENKLNALLYFKDFLMGIEESCSGEKISLKLNEIDCLINKIKLDKNDRDINLDVINFEFEDVTLDILINGYWCDVSKLVLEQIIGEIDYYFDFRYEDELENDTSISLNEIKEQCNDLIENADIQDQTYINRFNKLCHFMNNFWDELFTE